ncbi:MAG: hypothetical protein COZ25_04465 [Ignavibacteria bacterium CG_4_10_14_3_um_filter_37_18]|nr:MAG: hypothetical protein COZ25_04465 [Ignavibacteria bacterium CG_4_10_14_3_um_filter_37_18]
MKRVSQLAIVLICMLFNVETLLAQWTQTNGPYGGTINCIISDTSNLYIGTNKGGVFLSTDDGLSWTALNNGLTNPTINALAFSGQNLVAGTEGGGVFLSENKGLTWTAVSFPIPYVTAFTSLGNNLFAATWDGIYLSKDNGVTWAFSGLWNTYVSSLSTDGLNILAGTHRLGLFISSDTCKTWIASDSGISLSSKWVNTVLKDSAGIFAGTNEGVSLSKGHL